MSKFSLLKLYNLSEEQKDVEPTSSIEQSMQNLQVALKDAISQIKTCRRHCRITSKELEEINDSLKKS